MQKGRSLRGLALVLTISIVVPLCAVVWFALTLSLEDRATQSLDAQLMNEADLLEALMTEGEGAPPALGAYQEIFSGRYWQLSGGARDARSRSLWDFELASPNEAAVNASGPVEQKLRVHRRDLANGTVLVVAMDRADYDAMADKAAQSVLIALAILSALVITAVLIVVWVLTRPLARAAQEATAMREGKVQALSQDVPRELSPLVTAVNSNVAAREKVLERTRLQAANLAHALKTPLAVLRTKAGADLQLQLEAMGHEIDRALRRARIGGAVAGTHTDVQPIADDLARVLGRLFDTRPLTFDCTGTEGTSLPIDADDLHDLLGNLMENAAKWAKGQVRVSVQDKALIVEDDGPGIPEADRQRVLDAGVRLDEQVSGSGLGLALVADIAAAYDTRLAIDRSDLGGARIIIAFKAA